MPESDCYLSPRLPEARTQDQRPSHDGHLEGVKTKDGDLVILNIGEDESGNPDICVWEPTQADILATDWDVQ